MTSELRLVQIGEYVGTVRTWNPAQDSEDEKFRYIDIGSVSQEEKRIIPNGEMLVAEAPSRARQLVQAGDVLVSTVRPNLNAVAFVPEDMDGATASTGFCVLRPEPSRVYGRYLFHWVRSPRFVSDMTKQATGQSYPAVSDKIVKQSPLPLIPLDEQKRIAAILDQADELRRQRRRSIDRLNALGQAIFYDMFNDKTGKAEWRFPVDALSKVCTKITDGTHQAPRWSQNGIPFIFVSHIREQEISLDTEKFVDQEEYDNLTKHTPIEVGDVLYTCVGTYGNAAVIRRDDKFIFQRHIAQIKPDATKINPNFIAFCLETNELKRQADKVATGIAQKTVTLKGIKSFSVPIPPLQTQCEFSDRISLLNSVRAEQLKALSGLNALFSSLQHRAFLGKL